MPFEIIGVLEAKGVLADGSNEDNEVLIPIRTALRRVFNSTWLNPVFVGVRNPAEMAETENAIAKLLRDRHRLEPSGKPDDFSIQNKTKLAGLVPAERLAEYYRVIAHTRTLGPNDEMLRLLEAMGLLALLTRETPAEIAAERKSLQKIFESSASQANVVEKRMAGYASHLETRLAQLPKELETGLDPPRIAKLLGESLRQCFHQSGLPDTARALDQSCSEMNSVQRQLVNVLREVAHPDIGVIAKVRSANDLLLRSMTTRAQQMDNFLVRLEKQVWAIWLPVVATAALALGFALGTWFANVRQGTPEASSADQSQQMPMPEAPAQQVVPQRNAKHH